MITYMRAWMSFKFSQIKPLVTMVTNRVMMGKMVSPRFFRLFFIRSFLYLQVMMTCMRARKSSNFGLNGPPTAELAALERLKKKSPQAYYNGKNDVSNFSPLFLIGSFSCLQVMITYMRAWISLKISQI